MGQAQDVRDLLKLRDRIVETVCYSGEVHGLQKREHQRDALRRMGDER